MPRRQAIIEAGPRASAADPDDDLRADCGHDPGGAGLGEGADFRAPLGRAIIGGVITSRC
jgi:HAE1 family hydrophobic/amphiphilic exporter-1